MKSLSKSFSRRTVSCIFVLCISIAAIADHGSAPTVDSIDGNGAGVYNGALVAQTDRADWFSFCGTGGATVTIETSVGTFDTYLYLYSTPAPATAGDARSDYNQVDSDDDGGDGNNSKIEIVLPESGSYVTSVENVGSSSDEGTYTLTITGNVSVCQPPAPVPSVSFYSKLLMVGLLAMFGLFGIRRFQGT